MPYLPFHEYVNHFLVLDSNWTPKSVIASTLSILILSSFSVTQYLFSDLCPYEICSHLPTMGRFLWEPAARTISLGAPPARVIRSSCLPFVTVGDCGYSLKTHVFILNYGSIYYNISIARCMLYCCMPRCTGKGSFLFPWDKTVPANLRGGLTRTVGDNVSYQRLSSTLHGRGFQQRPVQAR